MDTTEKSPLSKTGLPLTGYQKKLLSDQDNKETMRDDTDKNREPGYGPPDREPPRDPDPGYGQPGRDPKPPRDPQPPRDPKPPRPPKPGPPQPPDHGRPRRHA